MHPEPCQIGDENLRLNGRDEMSVVQVIYIQLYVANLKLWTKNELFSLPESYTTRIPDTTTPAQD